MPAFNKRIDEAVENAISNARSKSLAFVGCDITAMQLHEYFYNKEDRVHSLHMAKLTSPFGYRWRHPAYGDFQINASVPCPSGVNVPMRPIKITGNVEKYDPLFLDAHKTYSQIELDWSYARDAFRWLQRHCNSPKEVRSVWPEIIYLMNEVDKPMAEQIDKWTPMRRYIPIDQHVAAMLKSASEAVRMWSLLPDASPKYLVKPL